MKELPIRKEGPQQKQPRPLNYTALEDQRGEQDHKVQDEQGLGHGTIVPRRICGGIMRGMG
jgi:hypothetical protein